MNKLFFLLVPIFIITIASCGSGGGGGSSSGPPGSPPPGSNTLTWTAPSTNTDTSLIVGTDLEGYKIYYGLTSSGPYNGPGSPQDIGCPASCWDEGKCTAGGACTYTVASLALDAEDWCFVVTAYDSLGNESAYSPEDCIN